jgi:hypothetical protein
LRFDLRLNAQVESGPASDPYASAIDLIQQLFAVMAAAAVAQLPAARMINRIDVARVGRERAV